MWPQPKERERLGDPKAPLESGSLGWGRGGRLLGMCPLCCRRLVGPGLGGTGVSSEGGKQGKGRFFRGRGNMPPSHTLGAAPQRDLN